MPKQAAVQQVSRQIAQAKLRHPRHVLIMLRNHLLLIITVVLRQVLVSKIINQLVNIRGLKELEH